MESSNDGIISRAVDRTITSWNAAAERILGHTAAEVIGRDVMVMIPPDQLQEAVELRERVVAGAQPPTFETARITKDGHRIDVALTLSPIKDNNGHIIGTATILRDITERKRAEEELRTSREQLRALAARLDTVREQETAMLAREIHDELGQVLTGLKMDLYWFSERLPENQPALAAKAASMSALVDATLQTVRDISGRLRHRVLEDLGLIPAIESQVQEFGKRSGIQCELISSVDTARLGSGRERP